MPTYELTLLLKKLPKAELAATLKRTATAILEQGGVIRQMDNLGLKPTPYKISAGGTTHREANYFVMKFDFDHRKTKSLKEGYHLDVDILRCRVMQHSSLQLKLKETDPCTLHLDLLPPPYRPSVQDMLKKGEARIKPRFKYNSGLEHYPFQR